MVKWSVPTILVAYAVFTLELLFVHYYYPLQAQLYTWQLDYAYIIQLIANLTRVDVHISIKLCSN